MVKTLARKNDQYQDRMINIGPEYWRFHKIYTGFCMRVNALLKVENSQAHHCTEGREDGGELLPGELRGLDHSTLGEKEARAHVVLKKGFIISLHPHRPISSWVLLSHQQVQRLLGRSAQACAQLNKLSTFCLMRFSLLFIPPLEIKLAKHFSPPTI